MQIGAPVPLALWTLPVGSPAYAVYEDGILKAFYVNDQAFSIAGVEGLPGTLGDKVDLHVEGVISDEDDRFFVFIATTAGKIYLNSAKELSDWLIEKHFNTIVPFTPETPGSQPIDQYISAQSRTSISIGSRILSCSSFVVANALIDMNVPPAARHVLMSLDEESEGSTDENLAATGLSVENEAEVIAPRYSFYLTGTFAESKSFYRKKIEKAEHDYVGRWTEGAVTHLVVPDVEKASNKFTKRAVEEGVPIIDIEAMEKLLEA